MQAGDASGTGLFDTANRKYDSKRLGSIDSGLEDKFPQLIGPNEVQLATQGFCYGWNTFMFVTVTATLLANIAFYHGSLFYMADSVRQKVMFWCYVSMTPHIQGTHVILCLIRSQCSMESDSVR